MVKKRGLMILLVLLFILAGCSEKETSKEESETPAESVQDQGAADEPVPKETTPNEEEPKPTSPKKVIPKGDTQTGDGKQPAAPKPSETETETETETEPVTEEPAVPAIIPSATTQEGPTELEEQQMTTLMDEYMANYPLAVNEGAFIYIMYLIDPASTFYNDQADYVLDTYDRNINETLLYYEISSITPVGEDTYHITVQESFNVYFGNEGRESIMNYENVYTVKKFQYGVFLITDLQVTTLI